ncbi:MAG TPA: flagellar biosynthetic protein FliR [Armatimonadota bacterium]|jgi:flagellar biosynthetic protein FliR
MLSPFPSIDQFVTFFFVLIRLGALFAVAQPFGSPQVPLQLRMAFTLVMAIALTPLVPQAAASVEAVPLILAATREMVLGLSLGFVVNLFFMSVQFAGELLDMNAGFSSATVLNPTFGTHNAVLGQFQVSIAMLVFLAMNGHHQVIQGALDSFRLAPAGVLSLAPSASSTVRMVADLFVAGLRISAPALIAILMADVALSMLARTAPSMNLFTIGFPIKMALGIAALAVSMPLFVGATEHLFSGLLTDLRLMMRGLAG